MLSIADCRFENDPRRKQELAGRHLADSIYSAVFGNVEVKRFDGNVLDKTFAIDTSIRISTGMMLTVQEKFLSNRYASFRSVTVEFLQNQHTGERGDWFRLSPMVYMVGYFTKDESTFDPWVLLDWPRVVIETHSNNIKWRDNKNKNGKARASFKYTIMDELPRSCVIASSL